MRTTVVAEPSGPMTFDQPGYEVRYRPTLTRWCVESYAVWNAGVIVYAGTDVPMRFATIHHRRYVATEAQAAEVAAEWAKTVEARG